MQPVSKSRTSVLVEIPPGTSTSGIARRLKDKGLVRSEFAFTLAVRVMGETGNIKAGEYRLTPNLGVLEIIERLITGRAEAVWLQVPEGKRVSELAVLVDEHGLGEGRDAFVMTANRRPSRYGLEIPVSRRSVEGYLFPDTYRFQRGVTNREVVVAMLRNWNTKVLKPHQARFRAAAYPLDKVMIIASLIEKEARVPQDRALISSVIHNRLRLKRKLEIDATVIYAIGYHKSVVTLDDLKIDHPHNTYRYAGLPPGPICSPGEASILAALEPAQTNYLYYVAQADGSHLFAETYEKHKANIARVKAEARAATPARGE